MTRAEEKALEIFPVKKVPYYGLACNSYSERDANLDKRELFCMGYEHAQKDTIERVIDWVRKNAYIYTDTQNNEEGNLMTVFLEKAFIDDLKKAIEEEL